MQTFFLWLSFIGSLLIKTNSTAINDAGAVKATGYKAVGLPVQLSSTKYFSRFAGEPIVASDSPSCIIPFSRAGNLIIIHAAIDTVEGNFILDTGAPHLVLNMTYFRNYRATAEATDNQGGITGNTDSYLPTQIPRLSFGPIKYYNLDADRINLGHIENSKGIKILGLLGIQLFKRFEMIIDYDQSVIYLHLIGRKAKSMAFHNPMLKDTSMYITNPITILEDKLLTTGYMEGKKLNFVIDTGAETNVLDSRLPNKIMENISITRRVMLAGTGNNKIEALYGYTNNIKIGKRGVTTLPVLVTNLEKMCYSYNRCIDGMLGFDFLSLQKIGFNFVSGKMYIWK